MKRQISFQQYRNIDLIILLAVLAVCQLLTHFAVTLLQISDDQTALRGVIYAVVMTVLFLASFVIQQRWVFVNKKET